MDRYLVFGHPVRHSKSPFIHTLFARQTQQALEYGLAEPAVDEFASALNHFFAEGGKGCNVTVPFKFEAAAVAQHLSPRAALAQDQQLQRPAGADEAVPPCSEASSDGMPPAPAPGSGSLPLVQQPDAQGAQS